MKCHIIAGIVSCILIAGCGGPTLVPVKGVATRGGQPLKQLRITFYPEKGALSWADTDDDGKFELFHGKDQKGALLGKHKVTAIFMPRGTQQEIDFASGKLVMHAEQHLIKEKYDQIEATPMIVEITKANADLQLKFD